MWRLVVRDRSKAMWSVAVLAVVSVLASSSVFALEAGDLAPAVTGSTLAGSPVPAFKGKVVIVDFWASWCGPCKTELPFLEKLHKTYGDRGLLVIGVSIDKDRAKAQELASSLGLTFPLYHDANHDLAKRYAPPTMPSSYVIDRTGKVRFVHAGFHGKDGPKLESEIKALL